MRSGGRTELRAEHKAMNGVPVPVTFYTTLDIQFIEGIRKDGRELGRIKKVI